MHIMARELRLAENKKMGRSILTTAFFFMKHIYLVNQITAHTALSTILAEHRDVLTYRRLYNHVWDKPLIAEGLTVVKIPLVKPCRNPERVVY